MQIIWNVTLYSQHFAFYWKLLAVNRIRTRGQQDYSSLGLFTLYLVLINNNSKRKNIYASIYPQNGKPYSEWNMCCALFEKAIQTTWWRKKWPCKILHIAGLLNSENPIQIQTETFIKHVLPAKVRAINRLKNTNYRTRKRQEWGGGGLMKKFLCVNEIKNAMINKIWHYLKMPYWIENSNQYPRFHVSSLFPHYCTHKMCKAKLSHKILFEDK